MSEEHPSKQRVLVTGGTGFIGAALLPALQRDGHELAVLSRDARRAQAQLGEGIMAIEDAATLPWTPDAVINLAGAGIADRPWTAARRALLRASRIDYTRELVESLGPDRLPAVWINASAVGYYGDCGAARVDEQAPCGAGFAAELCRDWEAAAAAAGCQRTVLLRIGLVLGPGGLLQRLRLPFSLGLGGRIGSGAQYMPWIHRDDVVGIIRHALGNAAVHGPVNTAAPAPVTNADFTRALARALHRPALLPVPAVVLKLLLGDMAEELLLGGQRISAERVEAEGYRFAYPQLDAALADLL